MIGFTPDPGAHLYLLPTQVNARIDHARACHPREWCAVWIAPNLGEITVARADRIAQTASCYLGVGATIATTDHQVIVAVYYADPRLDLLDYNPEAKLN